MTPGQFKDLCLDATDHVQVVEFCASAFGGPIESADDGDGCSVRLTGFPPIWINRVGEAESVKNRVHLDVSAAAVEPLLILGASLVAERSAFAVLEDPECNEFCAFD